MEIAKFIMDEMHIQVLESQKQRTGRWRVKLMGWREDGNGYIVLVTTLPDGLELEQAKQQLAAAVKKALDARGK